MLADKWFDTLGEALSRLRETQLTAIDRAAEMVVESVTSGGALHLYDTGHMLEREAVHRAGGLYMVTPFTFSLNLNDPARPRPGGTAPSPEEVAGFVRYALSSSSLRPGDVLIIGSVSGRAMIPIELALQARARGIKVVALTSIPYSKVAECQHPGGRRLYEVADLAIDYGTAIGDAAVEVPGLGVRACPTSGIVAAAIIWALTAQVIERLLARGLTPHVFKSVNLPDGPEFNARARKEYEQTGY